MDDKLKQPYQGQLIKFTNVVKGWQSRWFILDPERGSLEYYLNEGDKFEKARGFIQLAGAVVSPSDEDSLTFTVSPAVGESYKLRAHDTKNRQMWINRLRIIAEMHTRAIAHHHPPLTPREHRVRDELIPAQGKFGGALDVIDAFTQVADVLEETHRKHAALAQSIEELPSYGCSLRCVDQRTLLIKAASHATLLCLDQCLGALRSRHSSLHFATNHKPQHLSIKHRSNAFSSAHPTMHSPVPLCHPPSSPLKANCNSSTLASGLDDVQAQLLDSPIHNDDATEIESDCSDSDDHFSAHSTLKTDCPVVESQRSVIMHIISQLRLGMDLTKVTLPTFILEKRSLLEMFADFLGHPDYFLRIGSFVTPEERMAAVVKWYLTSVHVGRHGSVAKKPYNPIIGEVFHCRWRVPAVSLMEEISSTGKEGKEKDVKDKTYTIKYSSEQVSHHPPVSAFFFECAEKKICINAHIWTKSKFLGMSVGVNLVGNISLYLGEFMETYHLSMPSAFGRSILTEPWVELGGRVNIHCPQTNISAPITFYTKPFYGGKLHRVMCEVKNGCGTVLCRAQGEWDTAFDFTYEDGKTERINVCDMELRFRKRVRRIEHQEENESRRLWCDVTMALDRNCLQTATNQKRALEDRQRADERRRAASNTPFPTKLFQPSANEQWIYKDLPSYARQLNTDYCGYCSNTVID